METTTDIPIYSMSISLRIQWEAHALSNLGSEGSNRLLGRRQRLSTGELVDAISGNINKHYHAMLVAEYLEQMGVPLCMACQVRNGRRAAAWLTPPDKLAQILPHCGLCDIHGFLVLARNESGRKRLSHHGLVDFAEGLALPGRWAESRQPLSRIGDSKEEGAMLLSWYLRSGEYALAVRYKAAGVGMDTNKWQLLVTDPEQRLRRHQAVLMALRDQFVSPVGAQTTSHLPHLTNLTGVITISQSVRNAPVLSALHDNFIEQTQRLAASDLALSTYPFSDVVEFDSQMTRLAELSQPCLPPVVRLASEPGQVVKNPKRRSS